MILIDPGHGGKDPGAVANGLQEKDLTLQISLYQQKRFEQHGVKVEMIRVNDIDVELWDRMMQARNGFKLSLSNHINAGGGIGAEVWRSIRFNTSWPEKIIQEFKNISWNTRGVKTRLSTKYPGYDYYAMNNTYPCEGIIVEYGFIDSSDAQKLVSRWKELAEAVVKATVEYLGIEYIAEEEDVMKLIKKEPWKIDVGIEAIKNLASRGILNNPEAHIEILKESDEYSLDWLLLTICDRIAEKEGIPKIKEVN